ncbi:MAG: hypothetical protein WCI50_09175 [Actinomycetes bacterium]
MTMLPFERLRALARYDGDVDELVEEVADCLADFGSDPAQLVLVCRRLLAHHPANGALWWLCARVVGAADPGRAVADARAVRRRDRTAARLASVLPFPHDEPVAVVGWTPTVAAALAERPDLDVVSVRASHGARRAPIDRSVRFVEVHEALAVGCTHVLVEPRLAGAAAALVPTGTTEIHAALDAVLWLVTPVDRLLAGGLVAAARARLDAGARGGDDVGPGGGDPDGFGSVGSPVTDSDEWIDPAVAERIAGPGGLEEPARLAARIDCPAAPELSRS